MASDDQKRISQTLLCEIAGTSASTLNSWINKGRLRHSAQGYTEEDAISLAALRALMEALGPTDGPIAWEQLNSLDERASESDLVTLFDRQDKEASLISSMAELREGYVYGHPFAVVDLAGPIERVRLAFRRVST